MEQFDWSGVEDVWEHLARKSVWNGQIVSQINLKYIAMASKLMHIEKAQNKFSISMQIIVFQAYNLAINNIT